MERKDIRKRLARPAIKFAAGGFRPTHSDDESWLGRVFLFRPDESVPKNVAGIELHPYAQLYLPDLPFCSSALRGIRVLTLFISEPFPEPFEAMGDNWLIREYSFDEVLVRKDFASPNSPLKPFALQAELVDEDFPLWDGGGIPRDVELEILKLEDTGEIESYYDLVSHVFEHKIGGYPSYCQPGDDPGDDFEFVFQISSDTKINLNVVDSGSLMFWRNRVSGEWAIYYDFY